MMIHYYTVKKACDSARTVPSTAFPGTMLRVLRANASNQRPDT